MAQLVIEITVPHHWLLQFFLTSKLHNFEKNKVGGLPFKWGMVDQPQKGTFLVSFYGNFEIF